MKYRELKQCFSCANNLYDFCFHLGYHGLKIPKFLRRFAAKSKYHKAWLSGYSGAGIAGIIEREEWKIPLQDKSVY